MHKTYPLSELSKARLRRNNMISLVCAILTIGTAIVTSSLWIGIATLYFLAKFYFRTRILIIADPHLILSQDGLMHRWSREVFIPWGRIEEVVDTSKHIISVRHRIEGSDKSQVEKIYKWRVEADPEALIGQIRAGMNTSK